MKEEGSNGTEPALPCLAGGRQQADEQDDYKLSMHPGTSKTFNYSAADCSSS